MLKADIPPNNPLKANIRVSHRASLMYLHLFSWPTKWSESLKILKQKDSPILSVNCDSTQSLHNTHARAHPAEDGVFVVQVRRGC
jgi:hypothetical protein